MTAGPRRYHPIVFELLNRILGKRSKKTIVDEEDDGPFDPENPFPVVVVVPFSDIIDLHSIPPRQVRAVVEEYLAEAHRRGVRYLRIIHGKGIGVQREIVRSILDGTSFVAGYKDAPPDAGGVGATIITLRQS